MTSAIVTVQNAIDEQSDEQLHEELSNMFSPIFRALSESQIARKPIDATTETYWDVVVRVRVDLFNALRDERRSQYTQKFLSLVESSREQLAHHLKPSEDE